MKIDPQVYERMKSDIAALATHHKIDVATADGGKTGLKTMWTLLDSARRNRAYDNNHPAFKSGQWPRVLPYDGSEYTVYYKGGCNDSHVETALRKIKKELSEQRNVARPVLKPVKLSEEEWEAKYLPITKPGVNPDEESWSGQLFDADGGQDEVALLKRACLETPGCVWTLVETDGGMAIIEGYHTVNRIGYFITQHPSAPGCAFEVSIPDVAEEGIASQTP